MKNGLIRTNKFFFLLQILLSILIFSSCTNIFIGRNEIGSKNRPVQFYIDDSLQLPHDEIAQNIFEKCLEKQTSFNVKVNYTTDPKTLTNKLIQGSAQFGLMSALSYVEASESSSIDSVMLLSQKGTPSNRSIILGRTSSWKKIFDKNNTALNSKNLQKNENLSNINNGTLAYTSPDSDLGFLVPRMYFLQKNIFPESAIFLGSYDLVLQAISENKAIAGAVTESFLEEKFPNLFPVQIANQLGEFIVLGITEEIPDKVITENKSPSSTFTSIIEQGIEDCALSEKNDFKKIFAADGITKSNDKFFNFARELYHFQKDEVRVLTPEYE